MRSIPLRYSVAMRRLAVIGNPCGRLSSMRVVSLLASATENREVSGRRNAGSAMRAISARMRAVYKDDGEALTPFFHTICFADAIPADDPIFAREDTAKCAIHLLIFGRAKAALGLIKLEDRHRPEALSKLGQCMVYATHCSTTRFGAIVPKIPFTDADLVASPPDQR
jgi:hypothetical protein